ncbi:hypothetical protein [Novispirillum itersonii]|uniref:EAL domain-containing protein n=1 Tax=Novispirillum itersonii TaxID=189 RepID=A0A7X0DP55_NOVIT|nr:hypothetical protein [Novispirillum itersonii]MBB6210902.1 hypothetical protein [Novispirillum itersonii]
MTEPIVTLRSLQESTDQGDDFPQMGLANVVREYCAATVGLPRLYVFSLKEFREAFGSHWQAVAEGTVLAAERILQGWLGSRDAYSRQGDVSFVTFLAQNRSGEADQRATTIATDMRDRLLSGQPVTLKGNGVQVKGISLSELVDNAVAHMFERPSAAAQAQSQSNEILAKLHHQLSTVYAPVLTLDSGMVQGMQSIARRETETGRRSGQWVLNGGYDDPLTVAVDMHGLESLSAQLKATQPWKERPVFILPLHFRSMLGKNRERMVAQLQKAVPADRQMELRIELVGVLDNFPLSDLPQVISDLRSVCGGVFVRSLLSHLERIAPHAGRADAVGMDLNDLSRHGVSSEQRIRALQDFANLATVCRGRLPRLRYAWGLRDDEDLREAAKLKYALVSGFAVDGEGHDARVPYQKSVKGLG